jgi:hypothetical protein
MWWHSAFRGERKTVEGRANASVLLGHALPEYGTDEDDDTSDGEPSLGSTSTERGNAQEHWVQGLTRGYGNHDLEEQCKDEGRAARLNPTGPAPAPPAFTAALANLRLLQAPPVTAGLFFSRRRGVGRNVATVRQPVVSAQ